MARKTHHVVPNSRKGGWDVKRGGGSKSIVHTSKKEEAVKTVRVISQRPKFGTDYSLS